MNVLIDISLIIGVILFNYIVGYKLYTKEDNIWDLKLKKRDFM